MISKLYKQYPDLFDLQVKLGVLGFKLELFNLEPDEKILLVKYKNDESVANFNLDKKYSLDLRYPHNLVPEEQLSKVVELLQDFDKKDHKVRHIINSFDKEETIENKLDKIYNLLVEKL